jgi:hypothetical protein
MLKLRQAQDIDNQHIDILIELKRRLILIAHERIQGVKTLEFTVKYELGFTKFCPRVSPHKFLNE